MGIFESDFDCLTANATLSRNFVRFRYLTSSANCFSKMSKQQTSISSFFKPKNNDKSAQVASTKKPLGVSNKENEKDLVKKTKKVVLASDEEDESTEEEGSANDATVSE